VGHRRLEAGGAKRVPRDAGLCRALRVAACVGLAICLVVGPARAQWIEERVGACTLTAPVALEPRLRALAGSAREILPVLEADLGVRAAAPYRVYLMGPGAERDPLTAALERAAPRWAAGYMIPERRVGAVRVALANRYPYGTIESVFAHEVAHLLIHDAAPRGVPRWFNEGVATRAGRKWSLEDAWVYATSLLTASLPPLAEVETGFSGTEPAARLAYAASSSFVGWAESEYGARFVPEVLELAGAMPFEDAWRRATGAALEASEAAWRRDTLLRYRWIPALLTASGAVWALLGFLAFIGGVRKKLLARAQRACWAEEEAAFDAARADEGEPPAQDASPDSPDR
jgi:hypothetical protein